MEMENEPRGIVNGPQITVEEASCYETIPEVPVYRPTESEFRDFAACMAQIEGMGAQHMGLCKIIPPLSWHPRRNGYQDIDFLVEKPIIQLTTGTHGIYLQDVRSQKSMNFRKYEKFSTSPKNRTPPHSSVDELEEIYWKSIESIQPLYGANVNGSLTDKDQPYCNIPRLRSMLSEVLAEEEIEIGGVNTPYLYVGAWATTFAWHVEDMDLYSINYLHFGAPKLWYCIPPPFARKFEAFAREHFKSEFLACHSFMRHKSILIHPKVLAAAGIPTRRVLQNAGEIMCTFPYGYHAGFNTGLNCAESTNFALERWVEYGKQACICQCWEDTVRIDMDPFIRRFQPQHYEAWKNGEITTPHPLDVYKSRMTACKSASNDDSKGFSPKPDCLEDMLNAADLNVRGLYYSKRELAEANLPLYLCRNVRLQPLWCGAESNFKAIIRFNQLIGAEDPFCSICAYFWSPPNMRKALCEGRKKAVKEPVLKSSEPYLSEVVFCRSPSDFASIRTRLHLTSRILRCARCKVTVHACCYGVDENDLVASADDDTQSLDATWRCDVCVASMAGASDEPQCVLCPMRGGALKVLANPRRSGSDEHFWVHLGCAIAVGPQNCPFIDVPRRRPLLLSPSTKSSSSRHEKSNDISQNLMLDRSSIKSETNTSLRNSSTRQSNLLTSCIEDSTDSSDDDGEMDFKLPKSTAGLPGNPRISKPHRSSSSNSSRSRKAENEKMSTGVARKRRLHPPYWATSDDYVLLTPQKQSRSSSNPRSESLSCASRGENFRDRCEECGLKSPGGPDLDLPLVSCWHEDCSTKYHLTCAQFGGILIATSQYPFCFYITCRRHLSEYREFEHDEEIPPLTPGDMVYALHSGNGHYYKATVMSPAGPRLCKLAFSDGTFSRDTPSNYILDHDWKKSGMPKIGSNVKVRWTDGLVYSAVFQGASTDKWNVQFPNGQIHKVRREKIFRLTERIPQHIMNLIAQ
ncbi:hypothetical protein Aperf_G00000130283 [Anoplocephala perfoliata]